MRIGVFPATCAAVAGLVAGGGWVLFSGKQNQSGGKSPRDSAPWAIDLGSIAPEGKVMSRGLDDGDVQNAVRDFRRIYAAVDAYRRYYHDLPSLTQVVDTTRPLAPGYQLTPSDFDNPDRRFSDENLESSRKVVYGINIGNMRQRQDKRKDALWGKRPDGSPMSVFSSPRQRDVWITCNLYARTRRVLHSDGHSEIWIHGHDVVLWNDGVIDVIPAKDRMYRSAGRRTFLRAFKGQAGVKGPLLSEVEVHKDDRFNVYHYEVGKP